MCGLFGFSCYGETPFKDLPVLTNSLAEHSAVRGTDASGIAFVKSGNIQIHKEAKSAFSMQFRHPDGIRALIGHTRHATHGSETRNYNNHPFSGKAGITRFALAHNGVLWNTHLNLPKTKIETDSYAAVQLIEREKKLNFASLRTMAETVSGSFSFSILDDRDNLWLVKGDSPLSILHFPGKRMFVYASTDEILYKAIVDSPLFPALKQRQFEEIPVSQGTILKISPDGSLASESFRFRESLRPCWWEMGYTIDPVIRDADTEYLDALRTTALYQGIDPEEIDGLLEMGFSLDEIEEAIYEV
ncbi:MAG: class II glutamine amidotransferase [Clostridia bacterium]|nr:class II glutamine amidotransferase [Clostridia bacterium]